MNIFGNSYRIREVIRLVETVAPTQSNVLILGEPGTGKEMLARMIHEKSAIASAPFVRFDCVGFPADKYESALFGHVPTDSEHGTEEQRGIIEVAENGTLLLNEVSAIPLPIQPKLLRVIQERELFRVGNPEIQHINVRIIATSSRNLEHEVAHGRFRQDLYFRLNVIPIHLPPLRERKEDIPELARHFLHKSAADHKKNIRGISSEAIAFLSGYPWLGNIRELKNAIERGVILASTDMLEKKHFLFLSDQSIGRTGGVLTNTVGLTMHELEKQHIFATLAANRNNRTKTAQMLEISIRTLRNKLTEYREDGSFIENSDGSVNK